MIQYKRCEHCKSITGYTKEFKDMVLEYIDRMYDKDDAVRNVCERYKVKKKDVKLWIRQRQSLRCSQKTNSTILGNSSTDTSPQKP